MVTDPNDADTVEVVLKIRKCDSCGQKAVALEGRGVDCPTCNGNQGRANSDGKLFYTTGDVQTVEMTREGAEKVADSEIVEIRDGGEDL